MKTLVYILVLIILLSIGNVMLNKGKEVITRQDCQSTLNYMELYGPETIEYERYEHKFYTECVGIN